MNLLRCFLVPTITACALAAFGSAQTTPEVLALTDAAPLLARIDTTSCTVSVCAPAIAPAVPPYAGGVAHDPRDRATWLSNGTDLCKVDARTGCATVCASFPAPNLSAGTYVTGLAFNEQTQRLLNETASR